MQIEHIAIWCSNIETMKDFYCIWFKATANTRYTNTTKGFNSYFLSFDRGPRIELMQMPGIPENLNDILQQYKGLIHFAIAVGSKDEINRITEQLRIEKFKIVDEPRITGDGYYESVVLDPEGNRIELTV